MEVRQIMKGVKETKSKPSHAPLLLHQQVTLLLERPAPRADGPLRYLHVLADLLGRDADVPDVTDEEKQRSEDGERRPSVDEVECLGALEDVPACRLEPGRLGETKVGQIPREKRQDDLDV